VPTVLKCGSLNLLEPSGPVQGCNGIALPLSWYPNATDKANKNMFQLYQYQSAGRQHLSDLFPIKSGLKRGDALSPLRFNFALKYAVRKVQMNQYGLKFNGTHQPLVYADYVAILGGSVHNVKKDTEILLVGRKEIGLEVNADKNKYMVVSRGQNAGRSQNIKIDSIWELPYQIKILFSRN
jgi:hypothetical protein